MFAAPKESSPGRKGKAGGGGGGARGGGGGGRGDIDLLRDDFMPSPTDLGTSPTEPVPTDLSVSLFRFLSLPVIDSERLCVCVCVCVCVVCVCVRAFCSMYYLKDTCAYVAHTCPVYVPNCSSGRARLLTRSKGASTCACGDMEYATRGRIHVRLAQASSSNRSSRRSRRASKQQQARPSF